MTEADKAKAREKIEADRIRDEQTSADKAKKEAKEAQTKSFVSILKWVTAILVLLAFWRACSQGSDLSDKERVPVCRRSDAWQYAQQAVENVLKNPDEADFHNPLGWTVEDDSAHPGIGQMIVTGQVTATNLFNAKIKQTFKAVVRCENGTWYTGKVTFSER